MKKTIYLDNAATTRVHPQVLQAMMPFFCDEFANPAGGYNMAHFSNNAITQARIHCARLINALPDEIYFTSGGSEADNWALTSYAESNKSSGNHIITSQIEHKAILNTLKKLEHEGFRVTYIKPDKYGIVNPDDVEAAICPDTILISIMTANNEIGTIQDVKKIGRIAQKHNVAFHTDSVQAYGHIPIDVRDCNINMLSVSGHKLHGPKGVGFLYIKNKTNICPFIYGGSQENGMRAGTSNTPGIVGLGKASQLALINMKNNSEQISNLRNYTIEQIKKALPGGRLNGHPTKRLPNNVSFCFPNIQSHLLIEYLNLKRICVSAGSACSTGKAGPSHVLKAIDVPDEFSSGSIRITLSYENTKNEIDYLIYELVRFIKYRY